jgi:hypothetical protein
LVAQGTAQAAIDLGAPPRAAIRRILLPLQSPEIFARLRDRVRVADARRSTPAATFLLVMTTVAIVLGYFPVPPRGEGPTDGGRL